MMQTFFGPGGEDPESYYKAFSTDLLEAALNVGLLINGHGFSSFSSNALTNGLFLLLIFLTNIRQGRIRFRRYSGNRREESSSKHPKSKLGP